MSDPLPIETMNGNNGSTGRLTVTLLTPTPVSPELVLVDPELAAVARAELPDTPWIPPALLPLSANGVGITVPPTPATVPPTPAIPHPTKTPYPAPAPAPSKGKRRPVLYWLSLLAVFGLGLGIGNRMSRGSSEPQLLPAGLTTVTTHVRVGVPGTGRAAHPRSKPRSASTPKRRARPRANAVPSRSRKAPGQAHAARQPHGRGSSRVLSWASLPRADYYDVQLFRGTARILDLWPTTNRVEVPARWTYGGVDYRLTPGSYRWYVYPGFGPQTELRLGKLRARGIFVRASRT
jgi:hypothetical protein